MRTFTGLYSILLLSALSFGQSGFGPNWSDLPGYYPNRCGPYIPMITTPSESFSTVSSNPTGASNATAGLVAGARNSTLSMVSGDTDAVYTMPVWYSGGQTPLISPILQGSLPADAPVDQRRMRGPKSAEPLDSREETQREIATQKEWIYFSSAEHTAGHEKAADASGVKPPTRVYSNEDVRRQNQENGLVRHDGKTEKIQ